MLACLNADESTASIRHDVLARLAREELGRLRDGMLSGQAISDESQLTPQALAQAVKAQLAEIQASVLMPVVNATGILLHTNLGRAVLNPKAQQAVAAVAGTYSNLELDLASGRRTRRDVTLEPLLKTLTGCEAATVVNNNAAAVFLALSVLARPRENGTPSEVLTSRGELVEIGGSYRVPDVVRASGAQLVEVGTTNRTRIADYEQAITERTAVLLKTHTSNYRISGFTEETPLRDLVELGKRHDIPVLVDLGSGYIVTQGGLRLDEPDVQSILDDEPDLVCFSGDKLLGGPQAGIILGREELIAQIRKSPLWRVLRIDKLTVAALGATIASHLRIADQASSAAGRNMPTETEMEITAKLLQEKLSALKPDWQFSVCSSEGSYGGGSLPGQSIPTVVVSIEAPGWSADRLDCELRTGTPAIVGYSLKGSFVLNMLTLLPGDVGRICERIAALGQS